MSDNVKVVSLTFVSGATGSISQYVGLNTRAVVYISNVTGWNSAAGNTVVVLRGAPASGVSHVSIPGASISTETVGAMYIMSTAAGVPYISAGFGTATSGAGTITVMLSSDS